jgi:hypothetical protein
MFKWNVKMCTSKVGGEDVVWFMSIHMYHVRTNINFPANGRTGTSDIIHISWVVIGAQMIVKEAPHGAL